MCILQTSPGQNYLPALTRIVVGTESKWAWSMRHLGDGRVSLHVTGEGVYHSLREASADMAPDMSETELRDLWHVKLNDGTLLCLSEFDVFGIAAGAPLYTGYRSRCLAAKIRPCDLPSRTRKLEEAAPNDAPSCAVCLAQMHHGDISFAYVPCGHRVVCGKCESTIDAKWRRQCIVCKTDATQLLRIF